MPAAPAPPPPPPEAAPAQNFESALDRLENIVKRMEADRLPLEELLSCYEEGTRLVKTCGEFLAAAEQRIELIARDAQGGAQTVEFNAANVAAAGASAAPAPNPSNGARRASPVGAKPAKQSGTVSPPPVSATPNPHEVSLF